MRTFAGEGGSVIVPVARMRRRVAPVALPRSTAKVSVPSGVASVTMGTAMECVVRPGVKVRVPEVAV